MKKLINNVDDVVEDMLDGMSLAYPEYIRLIDGFNVIVRKDAPIKGKVGLVSGGGSGHEPAHGGYVGKGMLDAAVAGEVFTSPTPDQIYEAIKAVDSGKGVLLIVKNYTGDTMNFDIAKEMAEMDGIKVEAVIVDDDVAVEDSTYTAGRRGIAGTVFVHKIAGAMAESGASLEEVKTVAESVISNVRSMGMALSSCIVPAAGKPNFTLADDEVEIGIGIHGEPGTHREKIKTADEIAEHLVNKVLEDIQISKGDKVAIMINGLAATPYMELYIINKKVHELMEDRGIKVHRTFIGEYMTSLEMAGFSVTILRLNDKLEKLLDEESDTIAFKVN
ncbi:dihydroxyacetone kinase subunit DhaK [Clostridium fallax]|uniref:phosphoenolpyruvate--glycerone phosphotransferase n=1 Tax=Clostridium fallax TaxID=1533 RepID=A0A1M4SHP9_9CLOT|nr:dihydroxyacetone kinase subunit DhaK [Clostridium fallax]SHE31720.1 dihydroxyacetone kinase DhaK subunit [Clostridium fallax]SQB07836.1 dihydroxyacetone kinase subunit DhaK [Clostridium fallax]